MENQEKKFKIPNIPADAMVNITVSGSYIKRCQLLLIFLANDMGEEKLQAAVTKFKETQEIPNDIREAVFFTLMSLVAEMEKSATDQGKVDGKEFTKEELRKMYGGA